MCLVRYKSSCSARSARVQALASQYELLCNLIDRNAAQRAGGVQRDDEAVVPLPFILLQAGPQAAMDARLSTDEREAVLDYGRCAAHRFGCSGVRCCIQAHGDHQRQVSSCVPCNCAIRCRAIY